MSKAADTINEFLSRIESFDQELSGGSTAAGGEPLPLRVMLAVGTTGENLELWGGLNLALDTLIGPGSADDLIEEYWTPLERLLTRLLSLPPERIFVRNPGVKPKYMIIAGDEKDIEERKRSLSTAGVDATHLSIIPGSSYLEDAPGMAPIDWLRDGLSYFREFLLMVKERLSETKAETSGVEELPTKAVGDDTGEEWITSKEAVVMWREAASLAGVEIKYSNAATYISRETSAGNIVSNGLKGQGSRRLRRDSVNTYILEWVKKELALEGRG